MKHMELREQSATSHNTNELLMRFLIALLVAMVGSMCTQAAFAQRTTGTLRGQVLDPQEAAVASAQVTVTNEATSVSERAVTTSAGTYSFPSVLPGLYTVTIEQKGFKKAIKSHVNVLADQDNVADLRLELGAGSETVEVIAGSSQVQTTSSDLDNNFSADQIANLPVAGGILASALNLAILSPNVIAQPGGTVGTGGSVGGTRPRDNNFTVDGVDDNNLGVTGPNTTVIIDSIAQFSLQTNQFSAEYGHSAGGQFNLVTKTGTNNYHGAAYGYWQNRNFDSLDYLTKQSILSGSTPGIPAYDDDRFGGNLGGPIIKNKWFFFANFEYTTLHGNGGAIPVEGPTAAGLSLLQGMAADSVVSSVLSTYPVAASHNPAEDITVNGTVIPIGDTAVLSPLFQREKDFQANTDYHTGNHQFGARVTYNQASFITTVVPIEFNQATPLHNRKISLNDVWTANSNIVNDARIVYSYYFTGLFNPCTACPPAVTLQDLGATAVGPTDQQYQRQTTYGASDNLSWAHGKHTFKFGGQYTHFIDPQFFLSRSNGDNEYIHTQTFINDLVPDDTGQTLRNAGSGLFAGTQTLFAGFVQDDFKVTPRLTLNLGLRYEYWTNPLGSSLQSQNAISNVPGVVTFGNPKTDKNNFGPRFGFAFDPRGDGKTSIRGGFGISYDVKFQNFASITLPPQIQSELNEASACGLPSPPVWCTNGGTAFLANGGLPAVLVPPTTQAEARNLTTSYIDDTVMPKILTWSLGVQHELARNSTIEVRYLGTRGLELPLQVRRNFESYFDAGGQALPTYLNSASVPTTYTASTPTDTDFYNFNPNTYAAYGFSGNVTGDPPLGSSIYHAGSVDFTQKSAHGLYFNINYTYSHTIDDGTNEFNSSALNPRRAQDSTRIGEDRSSSDLDVRHKLAMSFQYELPKTHVQNGFLKAALNGYVLNSTLIAQSGQPVTLQSGGLDSNGNGDAAGDRATINPSGTGIIAGESGQGDVFAICENGSGSTYLAPTSFYANPNPTNGCNLNPGAPLGFDPAIGYTPVNPNDKYVITAPGAKSNLGRNSFFSPGFWTLNLSAFKNIYFGETKYLQFRAEAFNVLNHANYALSNGNVFSLAGSATALGAGGYVNPTDGNFLNAKIFNDGNRSLTLGAKFIF
jgi:carboxypeptidase family protein/TonB-dependent receptor-like protein